MDQKDHKETMDNLSREFPETEHLTELLPEQEDTSACSQADTDSPREEETPVSRRNRKGRKKKGLWKLLLLVLIALLVISGVRDFFGIGGGKDEVPITVSAGAGSSVIAEELKDAGVIHHPLLFKLYARFRGDVVYQKGTHFVTDSMSYSDLLEVFSSAAEIGEETRKVVIPEGYELWQIVDLLVENGLGNKETFYHEINHGTFDFDFVNEIPRTENRLEGYLYPDTYLFSVEESEHDILSRMLENFNEKVVPVYHGYGTEKTLDEILIFASVIEREAANDEERPLVASVFENRMEIGMKLESCATVQYILKERKEILSKDDIAIASPYNTYQNPGLPVGPIASPGISSIEAALNPADTDYLYFLATADGSGNLFSKTFAEHNKKLAETQGA